MKRDCSTCICKEGSCYPSTTIFDKDKTCKSYAPDYEGYIAELEDKLEQTENDLADYQFNYPTIKELQKELDYQKQARSIAENAVVDLTKENAELKAVERMALYSKLSDRLTKAREIIKIFLKYEICTLNIKDELADNIAKAEQFLKDCDIDNAIQQANKGLDFDKIADEMEQDLKDSEVEK